MGFATGMEAGRRLGKTWVDNYEKKKTEELQGSVFKAYEGVKADQMQVDAEGQAIEGQIKDTLSTNPDTLTTTVLTKMAENGVKLDNNVYTAVYGMTSQIGAMQESWKTNQLKKQNVALRGERLNQTVFNAAENEKRKVEVHESKKAGTWNPSGKKVTDSATPSVSTASPAELTKYQKWAKDNGETIPTNQTANNKLYAAYIQKTYPYEYPEKKQTVTGSAGSAKTTSEDTSNIPHGAVKGKQRWHKGKQKWITP